MGEAEEKYGGGDLTTLFLPAPSLYGELVRKEVTMAEARKGSVNRNAQKLKTRSP